MHCFVYPLRFTFTIQLNTQTEKQVQHTELQEINVKCINRNHRRLFPNDYSYFSYNFKKKQFFIMKTRNYIRQNVAV